MIGLIKAEFLKLSKSLGYKILLLCAVGIGILLGCLLTIMPFNREMNGYQAYLNAISETQCACVFASIFTAIFIGNDFSNRTFGMSITYGCSRRSLLLSKVMVYLIGMVSVLLITPLVSTSIVTAIRGFGQWNAEVTGHLTMSTLRLLLGWAALGGFCTLFAVWIKNIGGIIGAELGLLMLLIAFIQFTLFTDSPLFKPLLSFVFLYQLFTVTQPESTVMYLAVCSVTFAVSLIASLFLFERAEFK